MAFGDFQGALLDGPARGERATWLRDVTFRLDGRIDHLLLDEFQDTAPGQWRLLLPLAEEILAGGDELRTFFCVGDVKQSIYGWRGGEPRLLGRMGERHPGLVSEPLQRSYRSSPVVLDAVNRVFDGMERRVVFTSAGREAAHRATEEWVSSFAPHESALTDLPGAARLWWRRASATGSRARQRGALRGRPSRHTTSIEASIGVLLRTKKGSAALRPGRAGIEASDEGGKPLTDTAAVMGARAPAPRGSPRGRRGAAQVARSPVAEGSPPRRAGRRGEGVHAAGAGGGAELTRRLLRPTWAERAGPRRVGLAPPRPARRAGAGHGGEQRGRPAQGLRRLMRAKAIADPSAARVR